MFGLQLPLTVKPHTTLSNPCNKVRGKYFVKEVFLRLPSYVSLCRCVLIIVSWWCCRWQYNTSKSNETDSDNGVRDPGMSDADIAQLLNSDIESEEFDGFVK